MPFKSTFPNFCCSKHKKPVKCIKDDIKKYLSKELEKQY